MLLCTKVLPSIKKIWHDVTEKVYFHYAACREGANS